MMQGNVSVLPAIALCIFAAVSASFRKALDEPVQLVGPDAEHRGLVLISENIKLISQIEGPVATIAVVGKFHSGKSFLMNQLMGKYKGFGIGPSVKPETMGIWMWGQPMKVRLPSGETISLIFLDTEGFAANNVSENYDAKIFAMATLISSHLIYNSVKIIDQADIDYLELLARRTQLFALRSQLSRAKWRDGFVHDLLSFPPLLWVVQDFVQNTLDNETPTQWLHRLMNTHTRESEDYKISLLDIFKSLECHTLFLPAVKRHLLTDLSQAEERDLTEEYIQEREELSEKLRSSLKPKTKNGKPITGVELANLFEILVSASNDGSLAEVPSRWASFVEKIMSSATEDCTTFYESEMRVVFSSRSDGPINDLELVEWHKQAMDKSFTLLDQLLHGLPDSLDMALIQLKNNIESRHARQRDMNQKKVKLFCTSLSQKELLNVEQYARGIALPMPSIELKEELSTYIAGRLQMFEAALDELVTSEERDSYVTSLKQQSLQHLVDATLLQNERLLEGIFEGAVNSAVDGFAAKTKIGEPHTDVQLDRFVKEGADTALQVFDEGCQKFKNEKQYPLHKVLLKDLLHRQIETIKKENERLVSHLISSTVSKLSAKYVDKTGPGHLPLPVNDTELDLRLHGEADNIRMEFEQTLEDFTTSLVYRGAMKDLHNQIRAVGKQRKEENVEALMRAVHEPLARAKQIILLSADKYRTDFTLRTFIMDVCLLQLDEGKPKYWQDDLKRNIIRNFMSSDPELSVLIQKVQGLWSSILGFFPWILWLIGL